MVASDDSADLVAQLRAAMRARERAEEYALAKLLDEAAEEIERLDSLNASLWSDMREDR